MTDQPLLAVRDLRIRFGASVAVKSISFDLRRGETVALVGESGSGKSVTSLALMGLLGGAPHLSGSARFTSTQFGPLDLLTAPEQQLRQLRGREIAMIFQEPMSSLNPVHRCGEQIDEVLRHHLHLAAAAARQRTLELLTDAGLPDPPRAAQAYPHELSGGQKQRVMIAMALACNPALLIADEPTTALDVTVQARILKLLADLRARHDAALLFITHDLGVVAEIADRVLVLYRGELVESGLVRDIFRNPQHPYTRGLLACRPQRTAQRIAVLPTVADFLVTTTVSYEAALTASVSVVSSSPPQTLLTVSDITVRYPVKPGFFSRATGFVTAVDGVSLALAAGETLALVGESGCGKSTLGRVLLGLTVPTAGSVAFRQENITKFSSSRWRRYRREVQLIFQDPLAALDPMQTAGSALTEPMLVHGLHGSEAARRVRAFELLERVGLQAEHFGRYPHEFSGGQRQRLCIARALALEPQVLVCDESVSALDVSVQAQVLNLLNVLKRDLGLSMLFITHDLNVAWFIADRVAVMQRGKLVELGAADTIFDFPRHEYTRALLAAIPKAEPV
ncbi:MAG: ABC transporter ATP-binding protein [Hymenobacteraceae bacterium]|nr:ABC transporter ATP-binding protein [Hymenobacteraceae bacterium]